MTLERVEVLGFTDARSGLPFQGTSRLPLKLSGGKTATLTAHMRSGTCGNDLYVRVRYRLFGKTLHEPIKLVDVPELRSSC
jgi:hypothetical protein